MYFQLTESIKRRIILELRRYWQYHPKYPELVDNIQGKYAFSERPQYGIIVKVSGGNRVDMSADNFRGIVRSYVFLTKTNNKPGLALEWVREDSRAIQNNNGIFPSSAGVYYIDLTEDNEFYVDPLLDVRDEILERVTNTEWKLSQKPLKNTVKLHEMPSAARLFEGTDYTIDYTTKVITLTNPVTKGRHLVADYRYPAESTGPFTIIENRANTTAIPGVVLAFGRLCQKGDQMAVVVQESRQAASMEYGGRWEISLDCDIMARDIFAQQELVDRTLIYLWGIARSRMSREGLEMKDLSFGGESEEIYDETGDDYFFNANFTMTIEAEWSIYVPLAPMIKYASPVSDAQAKKISGLSDEEVVGIKSSIQTFEDLGLEIAEDPFYGKRSRTFEKIG